MGRERENKHTYPKNFKKMGMKRKMQSLLPKSKKENGYEGRKAGKYTQRIPGKWVCRLETKPVYPKPKNEMGTARKDKSIYPTTSKDMGMEQRK